jgi:hypothetical protein
VYARENRCIDAEAAFRDFFLLLRIATGNLEDRYIDGLMARLNLDQLTGEYELLVKRNKSGVATELAAELNATA